MNPIRLISTAIIDSLKKVSYMGFMVAALMGVAPLVVNGQVSTDTASVQVYFPIASAVVDTAYAGNGQRLGDLLDALHGAKVTHVEVSGNTSPDGSMNFNKQLSLDRATNLADWLQNALSLDQQVITITPKGIDWQGLIIAVEASDMRWRDEVLDILRNTPELVFDSRGRLVDSRKSRLMSLRRGDPYRYMMEHIFPQLRRGDATARFYCERVVVVPEDTVPTIPEVVVVVEEPDTTLYTGNEPVIHDGDSEQTADVNTGKMPVMLERYPVFALRTNLLLPLLNVGAELPIGNRWSIGADYYYPWVWPKKDNKNCFELIFVSAEARYWLGSKHSSATENRANRLLGHSFGVYGAWGYYDFEHNYKGRQGHGWSAGVDYLYAMPIAKGRLHLEFEIALGAIWSNGQPYTVREEGGILIRDKEKRKRFSYVGPTKVSVSLVLPINTVVKSLAPILP